MHLIVGVGALGMSIFIFYRALTYDSHSPGRWGVTRGAKVVSRFSLAMQGTLALLFSVMVSFESMPLEFRLALGVLGFVGVFLGMIYDQYIRKEELDDAQRRRACSGYSTLSAGTTGRLSELALVTSIIGVGVGYVLAGLISLGAVFPPFVVLQVYIGATAVSWVATILTLNATYGRKVPSGKGDSLKVVLRAAPLWSKALPCIALAISAIALLTVVLSGDSLQVASWSDAPPRTKAVFFVTVATMYCLPMPLVAAIRSHVLKRRDERG